jgi:hypothetical protein
MSQCQLNSIALPCGLNINNDTRYTLGWNATMVIYLCACGYLTLILFSQSLQVAFIIYQQSISGIMLGMTT